MTPPTPYALGLLYDSTHSLDLGTIHYLTPSTSLYPEAYCDVSDDDRVPIAVEHVVSLRIPINDEGQTPLGSGEGCKYTL